MDEYGSLDTAYDVAPEVDEVCFEGLDATTEEPIDWSSLEMEDATDGDDLAFDDTVDVDDPSDSFDDVGFYDFNGVDVNQDPERLDACLSDFSEDNWEGMSLDDKKESMEGLAQYMSDTMGLQDPPAIEYYDNADGGDFGGYSPEDNTLYINEHTLSSENTCEGVLANAEAADTITHEMWHAYQHECAANPTTEHDLMYQENFENYIRPEDDFDAYQSQLVEAEARAFADQVKARL